MGCVHSGGVAWAPQHYPARDARSQARRDRERVEAPDGVEPAKSRIERVSAPDASSFIYTTLTSKTTASPAATYLTQRLRVDFSLGAKL